MSRQLPDLYNQFILERNKAPQHFEIRPDAMHQLEAYNETCGDQFHLYLDIADSRISQLTFHGYGCAVSKASSSMLAEQLKGMTIAEAILFSTNYLDLFKVQELETDAFPACFRNFLPARSFPARIPCATLAWAPLIFFLKR